MGLAGAVKMGEGLVCHGRLLLVTRCSTSPLLGCVIIAFMRFTQRLIAGVLALSLVAPLLRADDLPELGDVASNDLSLAT